MVGNWTCRGFDNLRNWLWGCTISRKATIPRELACRYGNAKFHYSPRRGHANAYAGAHPAAEPDTGCNSGTSVCNRGACKHTNSDSDSALPHETPEPTPKHKKSRFTRASGKNFSLAFPTKANSNSLCRPASVDTNCESYDLIDFSSSSIASASFLTPRWSSPIISTPRGDKASSRSKTSSPSNRGPNGSRSRCVMR
jgi:hypothetical protein